MSKFTAIIGLFILTAIWGTTFTFSKIALQHLDPATLLMLRYGLATSIIFIYYLLFHPKENLKTALLRGGAMGLLNFVALRAQTIGLLYTTATNSAFITAFSVLLVPIVEILVFKKRLKTSLLIVMGLGFTGLYLLIFPQGWKFTPNIGDLITLVSAMAYAFQISLLPRFSRGYSTVEITLGFLIFSTWPNLWGFSIPSYQNLLPSLIPILYLAILATVVTILLQVHCQKVVSPITAGFIYLLEPVFGFSFAALVLKEGLTLIPAIGALIIILSTVIVNYEELKSLR